MLVEVFVVIFNLQVWIEQLDGIEKVKLMEYYCCFDVLYCCVKDKISFILDNWDVELVLNVFNKVLSIFVDM